MVYKTTEIADMLNTMTDIFDVVRVVDPKIWKIYNFDKSGDIEYVEYSCYRIWEKEKRCLNCISLRAINENRRLTKYEFVQDETYYVVAKPITIEDNNGDLHECSLEIVANITDEVFFSAIGKNDLVDKILKSEKLLYIDSLTKAYNRRYFDEKIYLSYGSERFSEKITFIMCDLKRFKSINDNYGHDAGDEVLKNVARVFITNVRDDDSVIRIGGDEFLIILNGADQMKAITVVDRIKKSMKDIVYDTQKELHAISNFGIAYTDNFINDDAFIANLLKQADNKMYEDKVIC